MNELDRMSGPIKLQDKYSKLEEPWVAGIVAQFNDYHVKVVKIQGEYIWHDHPNTDEVFIVIEGALKIAFRDREVVIKSGEIYVVPKGIEHKPSADAECKVLLIEPEFIASAGSSEQDYAGANDVWI